MDVALSDLLVCPRCGPTYGLVLLPYEADDRRVRSGVLGCANCRERYPVEGGVADLRVTGEPGEGVWGGEWGGFARADGRDRDAGDAPAVRLGGLLGLAADRGTVLLAGPVGVHGGALAELIDGVDVVVAGGAATGSGEGLGFTSRVRVSAVLPFRSGSMRGVALTGRAADLLLEEGARVLGADGRLVLDPAPDGLEGRLEPVGLTVLVAEGGAAVAGRPS